MDLSLDLATRFWLRVKKGSADECWPWLGYVKSNGYGRFDVWIPLGKGKKKRYYAHRIAYQLAHGAVAQNRDVDHECHNRDKSCSKAHACLHRRCCNPCHLRSVSRSINLRSGRISKRRTPLRSHCIYGHPFDQKNTYVTKQGYRQCKTCNCRRQKEVQYRKRKIK